MDRLKQRAAAAKVVIGRDHLPPISPFERVQFPLPFSEEQSDILVRTATP